jgi:competence protein ComEA
MPTPGERKALLFLGAVIVLGGGMRAAKAVTGHGPANAEAKAAIDAQIEAVDSARKSGKRKSKSKKPKGKAVTKIDVQTAPAVIDMDVATAEQIETLRGIGPAMAKRIVADRDSLGAFGSLKELQRVKGIGPRLAAKIDSSVPFSLVPRLSPTESSRPRSLQRGGRRPRRGKV